MIWLIVGLLLVFSIIFHEVGHGYAAKLNGDPTAQSLGRLTLNPVPHIDPLGTVILPAVLLIMQSPVLFGWAKPVPFNPLYFKNYRFGLIMVSLAGPFANLLLAIIFSTIMKFVGPQDPIFLPLFYATSINIILGVFNLFPIPPMDGSKVVLAFLPRHLQALFFSFERWGMVVVFLLLMTGILQKVLIPIYLVVLRFMTGMSF